MRVVALLRSASEDYGRHAGSELAAAIAYRTLFALVPFVAVLVAVLDAVLPETARQDVVDWVLGSFPGKTVEDSVERELERSGTVTSLAGLIAFVALIWTASGMTRSLRVALAVIWETGENLEFVRARLRDVAALGVLAVLVLGVFGLSLLSQIAVQLGVDVLGLDDAAGAFTTAVELAVPVAATFAALLIVYAFGSPLRRPFAQLWPSALVTAVAIVAGVAGYAFYLVRFASFNTVYGPLGAVLAFLALLYVVAALVLFGAELVTRSSRRVPAPAQ